LVGVIVAMVVEIGCDIAGTTCEVVGVGMGGGTAAITRVILVVAAIVVIVGCGVGGILVSILVLAIILLVVLLVFLFGILGVRKFVVLLPLHPPILEPNLDLPLCQAKGVGNFNTSPSGEVSIKVKFLLQLKSLVSSVGLPTTFPFKL